MGLRYGLSRRNALPDHPVRQTHYSQIIGWENSSMVAFPSVAVNTHMPSATVGFGGAMAVPL